MYLRWKALINTNSYRLMKHRGPFFFRSKLDSAGASRRPSG